METKKTKTHANPKKSYVLDLLKETPGMTYSEWNRKLVRLNISSRKDPKYSEYLDRMKRIYNLVKKDGFIYQPLTLQEFLEKKNFVWR